ncbi:MAG TPA: hypothetical protein PK385_00965 [Spirochaetota bacterium]|nr:hypothetical protein [Spirochaetota bacterium]HOS32735.1 hypothetical protein [Spirochaetota bacterium]HOS54609.1 hypothetical protein [Spirochaetota bacterium]HPK61603.1 hypothetical protein [Spirochaetota bacterium]HQF77107.1 hypothetical protein [Spirochaetota bacterium]
MIEKETLIKKIDKLSKSNLIEVNDFIDYLFIKNKKNRKRILNIKKSLKDINEGNSLTIKNSADLDDYFKDNGL